jgi:hypothetical protein
VEAEQGVLGSILQSPREAIAECVEKGINEQQFFIPAHRSIYTALCDMWDSSASIDLITFTQHLRDQNLLDSVGGAAYVTDLFTFVPCAANLAYYIDIVREKYERRLIIFAGTESVRRAYDEQADVDGAVLAELESRVASIRSLHGRNGAEQISIRSPAEILGLPRDGHANFLGDRLLAKTQALVIAGVGGIGKTRLLLQLLVAFIIGRIWCGIETHGSGLRCLMFQTENGIARLQRDLEALKTWAGELWKLVEERLFIQTLEKDSDSLLYLSEPENVRRLESVVRKFNPAMVAFDPLRDFGIGDLNTDTDMSATLRAIGRIARVGNPDRALILLHHAITGRVGVAKAFGLERTGFARNSKVLHTWARGVINVVAGAEDNNDQLVLTCGKNSNGKEFSPIAVRLNPDTMIYEVADDFDVEVWRQKVCGNSTRRTFRPEIIREIPWPQPELEKKQLVKAIRDETGCGHARAYTLIDDAKARQIIRCNKLTRTYAKI